MSFSIQAPQTLILINRSNGLTGLDILMIWPGIYAIRSQKNQVNTSTYLLGNKTDDILSSIQLNNEQSFYNQDQI